MDLVKAMKKLGKKMTGSDVTGTDLVTVVNNIADGYTGGDGSGEDKSVFYVNVEIRQNGSAWEFSADKTLDDLFDAYNDGKFLVAKVTEKENGAPEAYWNYFEMPLLGVNTHMQTIQGTREFVQSNTPTTGKASFIKDILNFNTWETSFQRITVATCTMV